MRILLLCWVFLLPFCSLLLDGFVSGQQCLGDQRALLLQLKNGLAVKLNESKRLARWDQDSDCCSWSGVTCKEGRVTGLDLSGEKISGGLYNSSLFDLRYLESLDLSYNNFMGSVVPEMIGNLLSLTTLNLSNSGFGGQIPKEMSELTSLVTLDLSVLQLYEISSLRLQNPSLRILVRNLSQLEELYLDGINISSQGSEWCGALSSSVHNLRVLSLTNCYLSGPIDQSLEKLPFLSVIRLDNNNLSTSVPRFFSSFSNLTSLRLSSCDLFGIVPKEIFQVSTLEIIDIANNQKLQGTFPEFPKNNALQRLVLRFTNFSGSLPLSFGNLQNMSFLDLSSCQFSGTLPNSIVKLSQLVYVDLSLNKFTGTIPSFKMSKNLTLLVISHNSLSGEVGSSHWEGLDKLVVIDLRNNLLNGSIPSSLFKLPSLELLQLSNNQFEGQLPKIQSATSLPLETLDLSSNKIQGPLPMSIFSLEKLNILSLSSNKLDGTVQLNHVRGLHNLTSLDLSNNNLSVVVGNDGLSWSSVKLRTLRLSSCNLKKFPNLKNQSSLTTLDLSNNQINEEVPSWIWEVGNGTLLHLNLSLNNLVSLQQPYYPRSILSVIDLHLNRISGSIPVLPPLASYIDFSSNNFTSFIPNDIGKNLSVAIFFSLSNNNLTGNLPESICNSNNIQVLDLSNNNLSGRLPACMLGPSQFLKWVRVLNLRWNQFSGPIPDSFPTGCGLRTLDLNGNFIEGKIPNSIANCSELEVLNLGNNQLSDEFPCMLKNISTLRVLVLRSNYFHGTISCHKRNVTEAEPWKMLQILDIAHNNFDGVIPPKCLSRYKAMHDHEDVNHIQLKILQNLYYQDAVTITIKGLELEFVKILTVLTSIDLSSNNFSGQISSNIGVLKALYALNLSHNALTGPIPPSIGNLSQLESLDLSSNSLTGQIPASLSSLTFLSFLNLSFNHLMGRIPSSTQLQTFSPSSFMGNKGLCGSPLDKLCDGSTMAPTAEHSDHPGSHLEIDWNIISRLVGFIFGFSVNVWPVLFVKSWRRQYFDCIDDIGVRIFPRLYQASFSKPTKLFWRWFHFTV